MPGFARVVLAAALGMSLGVAPAGAAGVYYVDNSSPSCTNVGPGTEAQPYCSIAAAVAAHNGPATMIIVKPGIYREQVTIPSSGLSGMPFVLKAHGPGVVVDGADGFVDPTKWVSYSGAVWLASSVTWSPKQVFVDGARIVMSTATPGALPIRAYTWVSGQGLYVNLGGDNPGLHQTLVGRRNYGFNMSAKSWVTIDGFTVTHTEDRGIYMQSGCTNVAIAHNTVTFANSYGVQAVGGSNHVIEGNLVSDSHNHGIGLISGTTGSTVRDNESFRNAHPTTRVANGIYLYGAPANAIYRNRVHDNQDTGLQIQSGSNDCVLYNNISWDNGDHGFDHLYATGTIHVGDVAYGNDKDGFSVEGTSTGTRLHNCIGVDNGLTTEEADLWVDSSSMSGFVSDYNIFWNSTSRPPFTHGSTSYATLAEYQAASGQDAHSLQADPRFVNPAAGDFRVRSGSPAIDSGDSGVPNWPQTDAEGNARVDVPSVPNTGAGPVPHADRGALEYLLTGRPIPYLVLRPSTGNAPLAVTADASGSYDEGGTIVSYVFTFGDGTVVGPQSSPTATHTFTTGTWTVTVTVTDNDGQTGTTSQTVPVESSLRAVLTVMPATGNGPLTVTADASGSWDSWRTIVSYRFNFGDGTVVGPQALPIAAHTFAPGYYNVSMAVTNDLGEVVIASQPVIAAPTGPGPNLVGNPSFEADAGGWGSVGSTLTRAAGGFDGAWALRVQGPGTTKPFGVTDHPAWIATTPAAGTRFLFRAWVRSATPGGSVRVRVREYSSGGRPLSPNVQSAPVILSTTWQLAAVEYACQAAGSTIDFQILDFPVAAGEVFALDNVSINIALGTSVLGVPAGEIVRLSPRVFPNPLRDRGLFRFELSDPGPLRVQLFDVAGRAVRTLADEAAAPATRYEFFLDGRADDGRSLGPGVYFYRVQALEGTATGRFMIVR